ncbi:MAG: HNH endonuclease signature motif containing protein [Planctomycetota bacterium]
MGIAQQDIKLLWGRAAGRCSAPGCKLDLTPLLEKSGPTVLGEMAHVIGRKPRAARSDPAVGSDNTYGNLILLCPNHHTEIDKAEKDYPAELLYKWKADWEAQVSGISVQVTSRADLFREVAIRLATNLTAFSQGGPMSDRAEASPQSCQSAAVWQLRRLGVIVPNNRSIVATLRKNIGLLTTAEWRSASLFIEHAEFYEMHCVDPKDVSAYLPFPAEFADMIDRGVEHG